MIIPPPATGDKNLVFNETTWLPTTKNQLTTKKSREEKYSPNLPTIMNCPKSDRLNNACLQITIVLFPNQF